MIFGIAAISIQGVNDTAILAADRIVSVGRGNDVEYEDTESNVEPFFQNDLLVAVAVGAGPSAYSDEVPETLSTLIARECSYLPTVRRVKEYSNV